METWTEEKGWDKVKERFYQEGTCGECKGQKEGKRGDNNRTDDYGHKEGFGDIKKGEREEKEDIIVGRNMIRIAWRVGGVRE